MAKSAVDDKQPLPYMSKHPATAFEDRPPAPWSSNRELTEKRQILDTNPSLHFALLRLQLVELIRDCEGGDITPALDFATQQLGPRAPTDAKFLEDLERTMALLIFPHDRSLKPELAEILHPDLRRKVADQTNKAILLKHTSRRDAALRQLLRTRGWAETKARELKKDLPDRLELGLGGEEGEAATGNGHDPMITT